MPPTTLLDNFVRTVCRLGQAADCCSYLTMRGGFYCCKEDPVLTAAVLRRRSIGAMQAMGDNCTGPPDFLPNRQTEDDAC